MKVTTKRRLWTEEEIEYLEYNYARESYEEMERVLGRPMRSIQTKAYSLGLTKGWTDYEVEFLKRNYSSTSMDVLVEKLERSKHSIFKKAERLKLRKHSICSKN